MRLKSGRAGVDASVMGTDIFSRASSDSATERETDMMCEHTRGGTYKVFTEGRWTEVFSPSAAGEEMPASAADATAALRASSSCRCLCSSIDTRRA